MVPGQVPPVVRATPRPPVDVRGPPVSCSKVVGPPFHPVVDGGRLASCVAPVGRPADVPSGTHPRTSLVETPGAVGTILDEVPVVPEEVGRVPPVVPVLGRP